MFRIPTTTKISRSRKTVGRGLIIITMTFSLPYKDVITYSQVTNLHLTVFSALIVFASLAFVFLIQNGKQNRKKVPPLAPVGILESMEGMSTNAPFFLQDMLKATGSDIIRLSLPIYGGAYAVGDPTAIRAIFTDKTSEKPAQVYAPIDYVTGGASVATRGNTKEWRSARKCLMYSFSGSEVNRMNRICTDQVNFWIKNRLEPSIQKNESFDPTAEMIMLTFNTILEAAFEYPEVVDYKEYAKFIHELNVSLKEFAGRHNCNPFRKYYGFLLSEYREAVEASAEVMKFAVNILETYRKNPNKSKNKTVIRMIVENDKYASDKERLSDIIIMILAGHETTGTTLSTTLILLAKHPEVAEKLRGELLLMDESKRSSRSGYLHHVIRESKRLVPVAASTSVRITGRSFLFKNGSIVIPKGAICFLSPMLAHHHKETFKDPENFRPERWEDESKEMHDALMSFAVGSRDCLGKALALAELYSVLPKLVIDYKFEVEKEGELTNFLSLKYVGSRLKTTRIEFD